MMTAKTKKQRSNMGGFTKHKGAVIATIVVLAFTLASAAFAFGAETPPDAPALELVSVMPVGTNVPMDTESAVIIFAQPMVPSSGTVTIDRGTLGEGTWSEGNTVLTLPLNIASSDYLTVHTLLLSGFVAESGGAPFADFTYSFRTVTETFDAPEGTLYKSLQAPEGTNLPSASFDFIFEPVVIEISATYGLNSRSGGPVINETISVDASTATVENGMISASNYRDLYEIFNSAFAGGSFPGGVYVFNVSEVLNSSGLEGMSYDTAAFQVRVTVGNSGSIGSIEIFAIENGTAVVDPKLDAATFLNIYTSETELEISKTIDENEFADLVNTFFDFEVGLTPPDTASIPTTLTAVIHDASGPIDDAGRSPVVIGAGNIFSFSLRDGERIVIPGLPVGTTFNALEAPHPEFAPSVGVVLGGNSVHSAMGQVNTALSSGDHSVIDGGRNAADFTNTHQFVPSTGLQIAGISLIPFLALAAGAAAYISNRRRKQIEHTPHA